MGSSAPDDVAEHYLRAATGHILENTGFTSTSDEALNVLTDVMRRFMRKVCDHSKMFAEHAGRTQLSPDDLTLAFRRMKYSTVELHDYLQQVGNIGVCKPVARFPVARPNPRPLFHPQPSAQELETRPEHIPDHYQAAHPEWTREGADYLAVMKPSTSAEKKVAAPDFPDFAGLNAKVLGLNRREKKTAPPLLTRTDDSSATGIRSSANLSSLKLNDHVDFASSLASKRKLNKTYSSLNNRSYTSSPMPSASSPLPPLLKRDDSHSRDQPSPLPIQKKEERTKFKPSSRKVPATQPPPTAPADEDTSPMPVLERGGFDFEGSNDVPLTPRASDGDDRNDDSPAPYDTSTYVPDDVLNANMDLFATLKEEAEKERIRKLEKEKERDEKLKRKEKNREKRKEEIRKKEEKKKKQEESKLEKERLKMERMEKAEKERRERVEREERLRREEEDRRAKEATPPMVAEPIPDAKPLKITISNPHTNRASSTFSPPKAPIVGANVDISSHPEGVKEEDDDSSTMPYVAAEEVVETAPTTFPLNLSMNSERKDSPSKSKKKNKKRDKDRDRSVSPHKEKKRDKEHKKKKKNKREHEEKDRKPNVKEVPVTIPEVKKEPTEQKITLKIRLGDQTPTTNEPSPSSPQEAPVRTKFFKTPVPDSEDKLPPLRLAMPQTKEIKKEEEQPPAEQKKKFYTKAELKKYDKEVPSEKEKLAKAKEEKKKRKEERRKKEEEKAAKQKEKEKEKEREKQREKDKEAAKEKDRLAQLELEKALLAPVKATMVSNGPKKKNKKPIKEEEAKKPVVTEDDEDDDEIWICPACSVAWTADATMVCCDMCDNWFHWHCVGLQVAPDEDVPWYCQKCAAKRQRKPEKRLSGKIDSGPSKKKKF